MEAPTSTWSDDPSLLPNDRSEIRKLYETGDHLLYLDEPECSDDPPIAIDSSELSRVISNYDQGFQITTRGNLLLQTVRYVLHLSYLPEYPRSDS